MSMDARLLPRAALLVSLSVLALASSAQAASHRTQFFLVTAPTAELARQVGEAAETSRRDLAIAWLGQELPPWRDICPIYVTPARGAGGETRFEFHHGEPGKWRMIVQGPPDRILDSVVPHEVLHMVFATHFGQGLPRWADEGACTTVEHISERSKQEHLLYECLMTDRGIPFNKMFAMREYPKDMLPLYAQGYSVVRFMLAVGGKRKFVEFVGEGLKTNNWTVATRRHFGFESLAQLQTQWLEWVRQGGREELAANFFVRPPEPMLAEATPQVAAPPVPAATLQDNAPVANVVANVEAPRTLPPMSEPAFQTLAPGSISKSQGQLVGIPSASPPTAVVSSEPYVPAPASMTGRPLPTSLASQGNSASNSAGSWYAQERDNYRTNRSSVDANQAVARPQPIEQAREVVIEQSRPPGALYGTPVPGTTVAGPLRASPGKIEPASSAKSQPSYAPGSTGGRAATYASGGRTIR